MPPLTVWVLARRDDPALPVLAAAPAGVDLRVGAGPGDFVGAPPADAIFNCSMGRKVLEPVWAMAPGVRWVHSRSAGVDGILFPALLDSPAVLTNARGVFSPALAEFVVGAVLFFAKDFRRMLGSQAAARWDPFDLDLVQGRTLGIVGYGDIGREVAKRARAFGMRVLAVRRQTEGAQDDPLVDELLPLAGRRDLLSRSDYAVVATPLTPETRGLIGADEIAAMKPDAVLINVGRGPVIVEAELVRALEARRIRGAALDVFDREPLPADHPFYRLDNVLLSAHTADHVHGWLDRAMECFLENLGRFRRGEPLLNVVDKERGY